MGPCASSTKPVCPTRSGRFAAPHGRMWPRRSGGCACGGPRPSVGRGPARWRARPQRGAVPRGAGLPPRAPLRAGIAATLITDNAAGAIMRNAGVDAVIVGADRIAANGDVANKVGTYTLAVLARAHRIPFYVAAPLSTVDLATPSGAEIPIEERPPEEVVTLGGVRVAPPEIRARNPAFDITPQEFVTAIVTDAGVVYPPYEAALQRAFAPPRRR